MRAFEHFKTLCCLGLPPESAMIAVTPVLHKILPHGWSHMWLFAPDGGFGPGYCENPGAARFRERLADFMDDPTSLVSLLIPAYRAVGIGWTLHRQGRGWLESAHYNEVEAPLDSCWVLDAMIGEDGRTFAGICLTRPRGARPFASDDVRRLDQLRPWLAHALRPQRSDRIALNEEEPFAKPGAPVASAQLILTPEAKLVFQTPGIEFLIRILGGEQNNYTRYVPIREKLPSPIKKLVQNIVGSVNGTSNEPPRMLLANAYGVLSLEAKWLVPADIASTEIANDPKGCLIAVTIELRENAVAHAARVLRDCGATPAQVKVGIHLALGKTKPMVAQELGLQISSVADLTKKLYQCLDIHNSAELGLKLWLGQKQDDSYQSLRQAG